MAYVRTVKTASGAVAVQIVHANRRGSREIEHIGSAHSPVEVELLKAAAQQRLHANQDTLGFDDGRPEGEALPIRSTQSRHLWEALSGVYDRLGFAVVAGGDEVFRSLVLARLVEPVSKLDSIRVLTELGISPPGYRTIFRRLPEYATAQWRQQLAGACADQVGLGPATLLLYDVSTLYITLLTRRRQVIIQGPPGTGKTYIARAIAEFIADDPAHVTIVQFHPGTSYEDFVQGLRPVPADPSMGFGVVNGPLIALARQAELSPESIFVLLIDEINRGNVPAVFGELYYLLEYRERSVTLTYGETQSLPENLLIIGTMNTADRSITSLDSAIRLRFYIRDLRPGQQPVDGILRRFLETHDPSLLWLAEVLDRANLLIDDPEQSVGPSHFMGDGMSEDWARRAWDNSVMPTLRELFYRHPQRTAELEFGSLNLNPWMGSSWFGGSGR